MLLADYHIIRRQQLKLLDLYTGDVSSIYWYFHGLNWRGPVAFVAGMWPLLRKDTPSALMYCSFKLTCAIAGLAISVDANTSPALQGWTRLYNLTFIVGLAIAFTVMSVLGYFFPPPGLGLDEPFTIIDGSEGEVEKGYRQSEVKV